MIEHEGSTDFERFALDHEAHNHCLGCGGCLLNPAGFVQDSPAWCVGCRDRIKKTIPAGAPLPWKGGWEFV